MREWITIQPVNPLTPATPWLVTLGSFLAASTLCAAVPETRVSIVDGRWHLNGEVTYRVTSVAFAPDEKTLATGSYDHTARVWDIKSGRARYTLRGHLGVVTIVAFSPDGKWLATGSLDTTVKLWNAKTGELRTTLSGHKSWVNSVVFSRDGWRLVSGSSDGTVKLWREGPGRLDGTLNATDAEVRTLISGDGDWNKPGVVKLWDVATMQLRQTLSTSGEVLSVACSPNGRIIAVACGDGTVKAWTITSERPK